MNPKKPDISEILSQNVKEKTFPFYPNFRITITNKAYKTIVEHSKENDQTEICGVLIGEIYKDEDGPFLEITNAIRGEHAENEANHVMFTHDTWSHINEIKDSQFAKEKIVGWYHSHPRFGIFLSEQDNFIHQNFFNQPWQVAYVYDPVEDNEGFFVWQGGTTVRIENYWINGLTRSIHEDLKELEDKSSSNFDIKVDELVLDTRKHGTNFMYVLGLLIFNLLLTAYLLFENYQLSSFMQKLGQGQTLLLMTSLKTFDAKQLNLVVAKMFGKSVSIKQQQNHIWAFGEVCTQRQKDMLLRTIISFEGVESVDLQGIKITQQYITAINETLEGIAYKIYADSSRSEDIYKINKDKIPDRNIIPTSLTLTMP